MKNKVKNIVIGTDANYLPRAIVFYLSLKDVLKNFTLNVICFDEVSFEVFKKLNYKNVKIFNPSEFEDEELLKTKATKKRLYEYYWSCNPSMGRKVIRKIKNEFIAMADCDLMFFASPEVIFQEFEGADVIIQPNNYSHLYSKDVVNIGYYCTSFQCFRNNANGRKILEWWHKECMKWCSSSFEGGKFSDQKYLDDWRNRFKNVREVTHPGTDIAPWNVQKFDISKIKGKLIINNKWPLIYYHFHSFKINFNNYKYIITGDRNNSYDINKNVVQLIYKPYIKRIVSVLKTIKKIPAFKEYIKTNPEGNYHVQEVKA